MSSAQADQSNQTYANFNVWCVNDFTLLSDLQPKLSWILADFFPGSAAMKLI